MLMLSNYWALMDEKQKRQISWIVTGMMLATFACVIALFGVNARADIFDTIGTEFRNIYTKIGIVVTGLAAVALAVCAFRWILGTDPQQVRSAKSWMLNIAIGLAVYWLAYVIITTVAGFSDTPVTVSNMQAGG